MMKDDERYRAEANERREKREERDRDRDRKETRKHVIVIATYLAMPLFFMAIVAGIQWTWKARQCEAACDLREQSHEYLFGQGCYCQDADGWYNPNDER